MENSNHNDSQNNKPNAQQGGANPHFRKHRGHRGGKNQRHHNNNNAAKESAEAREPSVAAPSENGGAPTEAAQNQPHPQKNQNKHHKNNHQRNQKGSRGYFRQPPEHASDEDELSLADLRARIVLKAADGSVPTPTPSVTDETVAATESAVEAETRTEAITEDYEPMMPAPETPTPIQSSEDRIEVIGVRFRTSGKMYYFDPNGKKPKKGDFAIVETVRGPEFGEVCLGVCTVNKKDVVLPLRPLIRVATEADIAHNEQNRAKEEAAMDVCREKIAQHKLDMKLIDSQYTFDNSKLLFYFSAEGRVDFRELVKDLGATFHTRIELRQIGVRDEARILGGLGVCGRTICCATFLPDFTQVSIKTAKEQNLSLNAGKISGICGKLMCCLHYEAALYAEENRRTPAPDSTVKTEDGIGTVISANPLAGTIRVLLKDGKDAGETTIKQYHRDTVTVIGKEKKNANKDNTGN